ncbi:MAG TPA: phosphate ABC transporter permease PstA [Acetobacteraceae bacterium]|nr:phosphate ABC transporter permease PstA [Acetobacteraceae bacterium]
MSDIALSVPRAITRRSARTRRMLSLAGWSACAVAFVLVALPVFDILFLVISRGLAAFSPALFTQVTNGTSGGLANAISGTLILSAGALLFGVPVGVGGGIYLAEFGNGRFGAIVRFVADVLTGIPSIVLGYFAYITLITGLGWHFSVLAGSVTLAIIIIPYMARLTELVLRQVPQSLREAAYALGAPERKVILRVVFPIGWPGILTSILLALAISVGETAPLIYTAGWSNYMWHGKLIGEPIGYLTYVIWSFINQPAASAHALAFAAGFLVIVTVLAINIAARLVLRRTGGGQ